MGGGICAALAGDRGLAVSGGATQVAPFGGERGCLRKFDVVRLGGGEVVGISSCTQAPSIACRSHKVRLRLATRELGRADAEQLNRHRKRLHPEVRQGLRRRASSTDVSRREFLFSGRVQLLKCAKIYTCFGSKYYGGLRGDTRQYAAAFPLITPVSWGDAPLSMDSCMHHSKGNDAGPVSCRTDRPTSIREIPFPKPLALSLPP